MQTLRYERRHDRWLVQSTSTGLVASGLPSTEPQWLLDILVVARAAGFGMDIPQPPPDFILWFRASDTYELREFIA
jgi:hypothetical protein